MIEDGWYVAFWTGVGGSQAPARMGVYLDGSLVRTRSYARLRDAKRAARMIVRSRLRRLRVVGIPGGLSREDWVPDEAGGRWSR